MLENTGVYLQTLFAGSSLLFLFSPHILAPTASDLGKYGRKDTILAGFHSDLNFLTIHGRSRYPGLHIWARNTGKRIPVKIPEGNYLLVQAGKQLEHLSGGLIKAGFHEVVVNEKTLTVSMIYYAFIPHHNYLFFRLLRSGKWKTQIAHSFAYHPPSSGTFPPTMILCPFRVWRTADGLTR